jgi:hypothetical protein
VAQHLEQLRALPPVYEAVYRSLSLELVALDVHFVSSLPVKQQPAYTAWADERPAHIV